MKIYMITILAAILFAFVNSFAFAQQEEFCLTEYEKHEPATHKAFQQADVLTGRNIPSIGDIRINLIFAISADDERPVSGWDHNPKPQGCNPHDVKPWMRNMLDSTKTQQSNNYHNFTNYFRKVSNGKLNIYGDVLYTTYPQQMEDDSLSYITRTKYVIQKMFGDGNDLINDCNVVGKGLDDYDNWTRQDSFNHKNEPDSTLDLTVVIFRDTKSLGVAYSPFNPYNIKNGYEVGNITYTRSRNLDRAFHVTVHEIAHHLLSSAHPYLQSSTVHPAYWGLYYTNGAANSTVNAYESEFLGWSDPIDLNDELNTGNGNITLYLDDFLTSGESAKYKINDTEYFYFENRQKVEKVDLNVVHYAETYDNATINESDKGIHILHVKRASPSPHPNTIYDGSIQNLKPISADGNWNWEYLSFSNECGSSELQPVLFKFNQNPDGYSFRDLIPIHGPLYLDEYNLHLFPAISNECHSYGRGKYFVSSFNTSSQSISYFSKNSNPPAQSLDGTPTHLTMSIKDENNGVLEVNFHTLSFDWPGKVEINQDLFISEELVIGEHTNLILNNGQLIFEENGSLDVLGKLNINGESVTGRLSASDANALKYIVNSEELRRSGVSLERLNESEDLASNAETKMNDNGFLIYPNPFNPSTIINFSLDNSADVLIEVFNVLGQKVTTIVQSTLPAGSHSYSFNGSNLSSGMYIIRASIDRDISHHNIMLLK